MARNPFGWSLPPGVTQRMIDEQLEDPSTEGPSAGSSEESPDEPDDDWEARSDEEEMKGEAYIYKTDNSIKHLTFTSSIPLSVLNAAVGGSIETVPYWNTHRGLPCVAFCNEEGKLKGLPYNVRANIAWLQERSHDVDDILVGDIIVITGNRAFMEAL